jgi:hypothetical protein
MKKLFSYFFHANIENVVKTITEESEELLFARQEGN